MKIRPWRAINVTSWPTLAWRSNLSAVQKGAGEMIGFGYEKIVTRLVAQRTDIGLDDAGQDDRLLALLYVEIIE